MGVGGEGVGKEEEKKKMYHAFDSKVSNGRGKKPLAPFPKRAILADPTHHPPFKQRERGGEARGGYDSRT